MALSSIVAGILKFSELAIFTIVERKILPDLVLGKRLIATAVLKEATGPILSLTSFTTSFSISSGSRFTPEFKQIKPTGISPFS